MIQGATRGACIAAILAGRQSIGVDLSLLTNALDSVDALPAGASVDRAHRFFYWQLTVQQGTHEVRIAPGVRLRVKIAMAGQD